MFSTYNDSAVARESSRAYGERLAREAAEAKRLAPLTPAQIQDAEELRAHVALVAERRATMPRLVQSSYDRLSDGEKEHARGARAKMVRNHHRPSLYFRHCLGSISLLANSCETCGRWTAVDASTGKLTGTAHTERCER